MEANEIVLEKGFRFRYATREEQEAAIKDQLRAPFSDIPQVFLEIHEPIERFSTWPSRFSQERANNAIQSALLSLRLMKGNPVGYSYSHWRIVDQPFQHEGELRSWVEMPSAAYRGNPYNLTLADTMDLQRLWPRVRRVVKIIDNEKKKDQESILSIALTRWDDSYGRAQERDKLIDYWTALDALFGSQTDHLRDMGTTVALVIAHYLGETASERRSIAEDIKRSFEVRSHIIHGKQRKSPHDLHEMVSKTGEHLRCALRKMVEENPS